MKILISTFITFFLTSSSLLAIPTEYSGLDLRGNEIKTIAPEKEITVAYFLSSTCPCSQGHFNHLNELQKEFPEYNFVGFHSNKSVTKERAMKYFSQFKIDFPILQDKDLTFANQFEALKTPHIFILNKEGDVLYQGAASNSRNPKNADEFYLRDNLTQLRKGIVPEVKYRKALGCYIQR